MHAVSAHMLLRAYRGWENCRGFFSGNWSWHQKKSSQKEEVFERQVGGNISGVGADPEDEVA